MKFYETMYIIHPILEMGRLHDLIIEINKDLSENNCEIVYTKLMGKKRMAYPIQKQKFGTYVVIQFKSDGSYNNNFNFNMKNNPNILRHMIITIGESDVEEQIEDIKDQISGLSRPTGNSEEKENASEEITNTDEVVEVSDSKQESNEEPGEEISSNEESLSKNNETKKEKEE